MKVLNRYLIKNKKKEVIHSVFYIQYIREYDIALVDRFRLVSSLPNPILMLFFLGQEKNDFPEKAVGFTYFTKFIKFLDKENLSHYEIPSYFSNEERVSAEYIDKIKRTWLYEKPRFNVSSPVLNREEHWSISNDIFSLKQHFKSLFATETEKISREDFERCIADLGEKKKKEVQNQYVEYYRDLNDDFFISKEDGFSICWGESCIDGVTKPLLTVVLD